MTGMARPEPTREQKRRALISAIALAAMALGIYLVMMFKVFVTL
ncbi:MAG TPA: hypothetical protein VH040_15240 [Usitatibacter sp.]|nr:hypothetical protein [Usitatibacter sp.]